MGADTFVLGDSYSGVYYDDGYYSNGVPYALESYAQIVDFNPAEGDKVVLTGDPNTYRISQVPYSGYTKLSYNQDIIALFENGVDFNLARDTIFDNVH